MDWLRRLCLGTFFAAQHLCLVCLITGGVSWLGGALFVATAWLANRRETSRTTQAPFVAESDSPREHEGGATERRTS